MTMASPPPSPSPCSSLPQDLTLNIASFLEIPELCSLGSCSRHFRELSSSDFLWLALSRRRWPSLFAIGAADRADAQGWKGFYMLRHRDLLCRISAVIGFVNRSARNNSIEVGEYLKAIESLASLDLGFEDVKMFLLASRHDALLNLVGVHYCMFSLAIPGEVVNQVLRARGISDRPICVFILRLGRWSFGYRLPDEHSYRKVTLGSLTTAGEADLCSILNRGAVHEVLRVQITSVAMK